MTRRPASRRPPRLDDPARAHVAREPKGPTRRDRLKAAHVSGRSVRFGRDELCDIMRRLVDGDARVRMGLPPFTGLSLQQVQDAVEELFGWKGDGPRARIAPARTLDGFVVARDRIIEVARGSGRIAFATSRPASLLGLLGALAHMAATAGGDVLEQVESAALGPGGLRLWWIDHVAVVTDHESLIADQGTDGAEEMLFALPRPDLVVADRSFAGVAVGRGIETVAFADLDAVALAVASWRGMAVRVVPLDSRRPPPAYAPLLELVREPPPDWPGPATLPIVADDPAGPRAG